MVLQIAPLNEISPQITGDEARINSVEAPTSWVAGETFEVKVTVCCNAPPLTECDDVFITVAGKETSKKNIGSGGCTTFTKQIQQKSGGQEVVIEAFEHDPLTGDDKTDQTSFFVEEAENRDEQEDRNREAEIISFLTQPPVLAGAAIIGAAFLAKPGREAGRRVVRRVRQ